MDFSAGASVPTGRGGCVGERWQDLNHDLLLSILTRLPTVDLIAGVSFACSLWRSAARHPTCWRCVDLSDWDSICRRLGAPVSFDRLFNWIFARGGESIEEMYFPSFAGCNELVVVAERLPNLLYLSLPNFNIDSKEFCQAITNFKSLKGMTLDVNLILNKTLKHIKDIFPNFSELKISGEDPYIDSSTASVICYHLPLLRKLEMVNSNVTYIAMLTFLDQLKQLEYLDISGYENSAITDIILDKATRLKVFLWHSNYDLGEFIECEHCGRGVNESDTETGLCCECELDQKVMEWLTHVNDYI